MKKSKKIRQHENLTNKIIGLCSVVIHGYFMHCYGIKAGIYLLKVNKSSYSRYENQSAYTERFNQTAYTERFNQSAYTERFNQSAYTERFNQSAYTERFYTEMQFVKAIFHAKLNCSTNKLKIQLFPIYLTHSTTLVSFYTLGKHKKNKFSYIVMGYRKKRVTWKVLEMVWNKSWKQIFFQ